MSAQGNRAAQIAQRIKACDDQLLDLELQLVGAEAQLASLDDLPEGIAARDQERSGCEEQVRTLRINAHGLRAAKAALEALQ